MDLADVTRETFVPHVGATFAARGVAADGAVHVLDLELRAATPLPAPPGDRGRRPFTLLFRGPVDRMLAQAIYALGHPVLGTLEIFIVPVGRSEAGIEYEAVFT